MATPQIWVKAHCRNERSSGSDIARLELTELLRHAKLFRQSFLIEKCNTNQSILHCECGTELRVVRYHCRQSICSDCQRVKAFRVSKEVEESLNLMRENAPGLRVLFLTLTTPSCDAQDLKRELNDLPKKFAKLIRRPELKAYLIGCVRVVEISFNQEAETFHPHLHVILVVRASYIGRGYISQARFLTLWQEVTKRADITQVRIKPVKPNQKKATTLAAEVAAVVRYMLKPIVPAKWTPESLSTLCKATHKRRQYEFLGDFKIARKMLPKYEPPCICASCARSQSSGIS